MRVVVEGGVVGRWAGAVVRPAMVVAVVVMVMPVGGSGVF